MDAMLVRILESEHGPLPGSPMARLPFGDMRDPASLREERRRALDLLLRLVDGNEVARG